MQILRTFRFFVVRFFDLRTRQTRADDEQLMTAHVARKFVVEGDGERFRRAERITRRRLRVQRNETVTFVGPQSGPLGMATTNSCTPAAPFTVMLPIALRVF